MIIIKKNLYQTDVSRLAAILCVVVGCFQIASSASAEAENIPSSPATRKYRERQGSFVPTESTMKRRDWMDGNAVIRFVPRFASAAQFLDSKVDVVNPADGSVSKMAVEEALYKYLDTFEREMNELKKLNPHFEQLSGESDSSYKTRIERIWATIKRAEVAVFKATSLEKSLMKEFAGSFGPAAVAVDAKDLKIPGATSTSEYRSFQDVESRQLFTHRRLFGPERYKELLRSEALLNGNSDGSLVQPRVRLAERLAHIRGIEKAGLETQVINLRDSPSQGEQSRSLRGQLRGSLGHNWSRLPTGGRIQIAVALGSFMVSNVAPAGEAEPAPESEKMVGEAIGSTTPAEFNRNRAGAGRPTSR